MQASTTTDETNGTDTKFRHSSFVIRHSQKIRTAIGQIHRVLRRFLGAAIYHHDGHRFGNRGLPTKHTKATKALSGRFCFIGVLRVFRGQDFFMNHPRYQRAELWEQRDRRKSREGSGERARVASEFQIRG